MTKETPVHYDRIGREIALGDVVAVADFNGLMLAKVTKLNPKMIKVRRLPDSARRHESNKYAKDAVKLDNEEVAIYLLGGGK